MDDMGMYEHQMVQKYCTISRLVVQDNVLRDEDKTMRLWQTRVCILDSSLVSM